MSRINRFLKTLGPGILFASTAIGVSHLVQATRAGAGYGFELLWAILLANLFKYPFFEYGSRYANATGKSILDGYLNLGKWNTTVPQETEITVRHLLTHTSGLSYGWEDTYVDSLYRVANASAWDAPLDEKMKALAALPLNFQPGSQYKYGLSIDVAGYIVEILSGQPLDEFFQTEIFGPLKMDDTGFYVPESKHDRFAVLFRRDEEDSLIAMEGVFAEVFQKPGIHFSGGGGLVSTLDDYKKFCLMLLNGGELNGTRILEEGTANIIMTDQMPEGTKYEDDKGYGLGGDVYFDTEEYSWGGAASTSFWIDPRNDMIIIACAQLMPSDYTYSRAFRDIVRSGLIDQNP